MEAAPVRMAVPGAAFRRRAIPFLKLAVFLALSLPALQLAWDATATPLRANPYPTLIRETGLWSMRLLVAGLAIAPLRASGVWPGLVRLRRMVGLFAAFYAAAHLVIWAKDYDFDWSFIAGEIWARLYLLIGLGAALLLVPLAATSMNAAIHSLGGRNWRRLHRIVYAAVIIALIHYFLAAPGGPDEFRFEALVVALCLGFRVLAAMVTAARRLPPPPAVSGE